MTPNEERIMGLKVRQLLDSGAHSVDDSIAERLRAAREHALDHQRVGVARLRLTGTGGTLSIHAFSRSARAFAAVAALCMGMAFTYYWNELETADENAEVDSALLADELPIDAYTDQGFTAWQERSGQDSQ